MDSLNHTGIYRIYLAGKISKNGWRGRFVPGLRNAISDQELRENSRTHSGGQIELDAFSQRIELSPGIHYVGPYFVSCDHGCAHDGGNHGFSGGCISSSGAGVVDPEDVKHDGAWTPSRDRAAAHCADQIQSATHVIAVIEDDAHGTLVEIGIAYGAGKEIYVTCNVDCDETYKDITDLKAWFPFHLPDAHHKCCVKHALNDISTFTMIQLEYDLCESPIEMSFLSEMRRHPVLASFKPAVKIMGGKYRIDFADIGQKIGVELDGHQYHSDSDTFHNDRVRQREIEMDGWRIVRFSGREIHRDAKQSVNELLQWLRTVNPADTH